MKDGEPLPDRRPLTLAACFLEHMRWAEVEWRFIGRAERPVRIMPRDLRHWREEFYVFRTCVYRKLLLEELEADLVAFLNQLQTYNAKGDAVAPLHVDSSVINNTIRQLRAVCQARCESMPAWLDGEDRPDAVRVIAFTNGLLDVEEWRADPAIKPIAPTHHWFSQTVLPRAYTPEAKCPRTIEFFYEALGDDEQVNLLQEWLGYSLTRETRMQKMLWLHGVGGGGKGTTAKLMTELVGEANAVSFGLFDLTERFTLSSFVGKTLAVSHDAHLGQSSDAQKVIEHVLAIAGEDDRNIDRKNRDLLPNVKLGTRLVICTNGFPHLPDAGIALRRRSLILSFTRSFSGSADPYLFDKLRLELPGLTAWALQGLRRLYARGRFGTTQRCEELLDRLGRLSSPVRSFVEDCCEVAPETEKRPRELKRIVYEAWKLWQQANGHKPMALNTFCERLYEAFPTVRSSRPRAGEGKRRSTTIEGLIINSDVRAKLNSEEMTEEEAAEWSGSAA